MYLMEKYGRDKWGHTKQTKWLIFHRQHKISRGVRRRIIFWQHVLTFKTFFRNSLTMVEGGVGKILENSTLSAQVNGKYISKKRWFGWVTAYNHSRAFFFSLKECFCATSAQNLGRQEPDNMKVVNLSPWELRIWDFLDNQPWAEYSKFIDRSRRGEHQNDYASSFWWCYNQAAEMQGEKSVSQHAECTGPVCPGAWEYRLWWTARLTHSLGKEEHF